MKELPGHLADKYRVYAISFEEEYGSRPHDNLILVHVGRPISFETLCDTYIFQHLELTIDKTGQKIKTNTISGVYKIPNDNKPKYELSMDGRLLEPR